MDYHDYLYLNPTRVVEDDLTDLRQKETAYAHLRRELDGALISYKDPYEKLSKAISEDMKVSNAYYSAAFSFSGYGLDTRLYY